MIIKINLSNKFNITLIIIQIIAIVLFVLGNAWSICFLIGISVEGVFFIVLGIKYFFDNKEISRREDLLESLPMQKADIEVMEKNNNRKIKSNKFQAILYILMGIILVFIILF